MEPPANGAFILCGTVMETCLQPQQRGVCAREDEEVDGLISVTMALARQQRRSADPVERLLTRRLANRRWQNELVHTHTARAHLTALHRLCDLWHCNTMNNTHAHTLASQWLHY